MVQVAEGARRINVREIGRWRLLRRSTAIAAVLLLVQLPLILAVRGGDPGGVGVPGACEIPARLSILVDLLFIYTYLPAAWRGRWYIAEKQPAETVLKAVSLLGTTLVTIAALLDLAENFVLWQRFGSPVLGSGACASLEVATLTPLLRTFWSAGVVLLFLAFLACLNPVHRRLPWLARLSAPLDRVRERMRRAVVVEPQGERTTPITHPATTEGGTVICCSGGGIRSAAFSLGALQLFSEKGLYQKASAVIGVSGGGYLAAAFHVVRKSLRLEDPPPFAPGSPELARLRRRTRYLLPSVAVSARGIMSLVYGVVVNLVLAAVLLRGVSWLLGWAIHEAGILGPGDRSAQYGQLPVWYWIAALGPLALVVGIFLVEATVDRFHVPPRLLRTEARDFAQWLTIPALITPVLFLGVPWVLARFIAWREPVTAGAPAIATGGVDILLNTELGVAAVGGLGAALLALARSAWKGFTETNSIGLADGMITQIAGWVRVQLVPWLGTVLISVVGVIVLLGWTMNYARNAEWRGDWDVAVACAVLVLAIRVFTDATRTSLHPYYRERLSNAYLVRRTDGDALPYEYTLPMPYSDWARPSGSADGGPELVVVAAASAFDRDFVPADRNCVPFIFDPHRTGVVGDVSLPPQGMVRTDAYERRADYRRRDVTVPGAIAISGAAFSPLTGRDYFRTRPMRLLFAMVNARLGVWLPNPYWGTSSSSASFADRCRAAADAGKGGAFGRVLAVAASGWAHIVSLVDKPGPYRLFKEAFGATSLYDRRLYVTDGGHYDQLGLVEALRRRPDRIIVVDASNDTEDVFTSVGLAIATARMDLGVEIDLDLRTMRRGDGGVRAERAWARGIATCPDGKTIEVYVLKALLTPDLPWDVEAYAARHPEFPRRTTSDQLYGEFDFEAYRELGHHLADTMLIGLEDADRPEAPRQQVR